MVMSQCFVCREETVIATVVYPHVCVFARLWVLCIYCVCDGHVELSGAVVTLTQSLSVTADLDTHWHSGRGKVKLLSPGGLVLDAL